MTDVLAQATQALRTLYGTSGVSSAARRAADTWLQEFQRQDAAWVVSDRLLASGDQTLQFFAAKTMQRKVAFEFGRLPADARGSLWSSLMAHFARFSSGPRTVLVQLCSTIAAFAMQTPEREDLVDELTARFSGEAAAQRALMTLLATLADEVRNYRSAASKHMRDAYTAQLSAALPGVMEYLQQAATRGASDAAVQCDVLGCFFAWLRCCRIPPAIAAASPLIPAAFAALHRPATFEAGVDVITECLKCYWDVAAHAAVVAVLIPSVMQLKPAYDAAARSADPDQIEVARGLARVFAELGESYVEIIVGPAEQSQGAIVATLGECSCHPAFKVAKQTSNFWYRLQDRLVEMRRCDASGGRRTEAEAASTQRLAAARLAQFAPVACAVIRAAVHRLRYPLDYWEQSEDEAEWFEKTQRGQTVELICDICRLVGVDACVRELGGLLQQSCAELQGSGEWRGVEAVLHALCGLRRSVPRTEALLIPGVMALLPQLPKSPLLLCTAARFVGAYAAWLRVNPTHLTPSFTMLAQVSVLLCTVTFHTNLAHSLTRSP